MKKAFMTTVFLSALIALNNFPGQAALLPRGNIDAGTVKSTACKNYKKFPSGDFSKLVCLTDIVKTKGFEIIYNGKSYWPKKISLLISTYIRMNYKNEKAEDWIEKYAYRSPSKGRIIYLKDPQGKMFVLKDVLLQELKTLPA